VCSDGCRNVILPSAGSGVSATTESTFLSHSGVMFVEPHTAIEDQSRQHVQQEYGSEPTLQALLCPTKEM
jgi:hypothetical protein